MRRLPESKSDSLERFGRSRVPACQLWAKTNPRAEKRPYCRCTKSASDSWRLSRASRTRWMLASLVDLPGDGDAGARQVDSLGNARPSCAAAR